MDASLELLNSFTSLMCEKREIEGRIIVAKEELVRHLADKGMYECLSINAGAIHRRTRQKR